MFAYDNTAMAATDSVVGKDESIVLPVTHRFRLSIRPSLKLQIVPDKLSFYWRTFFKLPLPDMLPDDDKYDARIESLFEMLLKLKEDDDSRDTVSIVASFEQFYDHRPPVIGQSRIDEEIEKLRSLEVTEAENRHSVFSISIKIDWK